MPIKKFPENFLWGVAYSSHQVEGNNKNNDWWQWEQQGKTKEKSGWACDSWNRYPIDHELVQELGAGGLRLSLEWSRIEPEEGKFSDEAIEHYRKVLVDLRNRGIKRVVTLWHWTLPLWFADQYGWHHKRSVELFAHYCEKVMKELGDEIDILITLNEPRLHLNRGYIIGEFPPGKKNPWAFFRARRNLVQAHIRCYDICKEIKKDLPVGLTQYTNDFDFVGKVWYLRFLTEKIESLYNWYFFDQIGDKQDFIGVNYYYGYDVKISFVPPFVHRETHDYLRSDMGWEFSPEGIFEVVLDAWRKYKKPIYIFENGAADREDEIRERYINGHLIWLHKAIERGVDLRGYFYWSLLDNFEWVEGFWPCFGLVEMDFKTMERKPRKSFYFYQKVIKENGVEEA